MRRLAVPQYILKHNRPAVELLGRTELISRSIKKRQDIAPEVSIIIPAFNEESNILKTLSSLADNQTEKSVEIIVVNNNSTDGTANHARAAGAVCVEEQQQGITAARNCGLRHARGRYILNADADTIYPPRWIDLMLQPLHDDGVAMVYGEHYLLPDPPNGRGLYLLYEKAAAISRSFNRRFREEAVNVYGFNSAFRKEEGLLVDGFDHPAGTNEDGWLAIKLRQKFRKRLFFQSSADAVVWTSNRRIKAEGGLAKAAISRMRRFLKI